MSESEQEFQGLLAHIREHFAEAVSPPSAEEVAEAREHLQAAFPTHDALLAQAARLESSNHRLVRALNRLTQEITTLKLGLASVTWSDKKSIEANLAFVQHDGEPLLLSALDRFAEVTRKKEASNSAKARAAKHTDPDKAFVKECWLAWQAAPSMYKSKSAFARDMASKELKVACNRETIVRWINDWQAEEKA